MYLYSSRLQHHIEENSNSWFWDPNSKGNFNTKVVDHCLISQTSLHIYYSHWKKLW